MKNFIKTSVFFLAIIVIFPLTSLAADRILPLPKPTVEESVKKITADKKNVYPEPKPKIKSEKKQT